MCRWQRLRYMALAVMLLGALSIAARSEARKLTDALVEGYRGTQRSFLSDPPSFCPCFFAQSLASALSAATSQAITQDVPIASVAPAFSYRYNPALNIFERSTGMLGPLFAERALTIGKGKFNFNIGYAYVEFDDINGTSTLTFKSCSHDFTSCFPRQIVSKPLASSVAGN